MDRVRRQQTISIHPDSTFPLVVQVVEKRRRRFHVKKVDPAAHSIDLDVLFSLWEFIIPQSHYWSNGEAWVTVEPGKGGGSIVTFTSEPADTWLGGSLNWVNGRASARLFFKDLRESVAGLTGGA